MSPVLATLCSFVVYLLGYHLYAKHIANNVFDLTGKIQSPAHTLEDGHDYVPCRRYVLFGHHYASIAGLAPMLGPAIAVMWGWLPAMLWVVFGTIFIGAVHDFSALAVSLRSKGKSIAKVAEAVIGTRAKNLFHVIMIFLIALAMGVFVQVVSQLFSTRFYPEAVFPSGVLMVLALGVGFLFYRKGVPLGRLTFVSFALTLLAVYLGRVLPSPNVGVPTWTYILLGYAFLASVLPVWLLLQPRDFLNSLLLYLGIVAVLLGFFLLRPSFVAPAIVPDPPGAPPLYPFVFIVIACGAVSGFHALVSSGTTAKQLDKEGDAVFVGYGGMIGESVLVWLRYWPAQRASAARRPGESTTRIGRPPTDSRRTSTPSFPARGLSSRTSGWTLNWGRPLLRWSLSLSRSLHWTRRRDCSDIASRKLRKR